MHSCLLVANRAEVAVRVMRTANDLGITTVAVAPAEDQKGLHWRLASRRALLPGKGPAAYLDVGAIVGAAVDHGCDAVHPGYGFLSESSAFAEACVAAGLAFVGPSVQTLRVLGDKTLALKLAKEESVPVPRSSGVLADSTEAEAFVAQNGHTMLKAVAGGGGRGLRMVDPSDDVAAAFARCQSEAVGAFGNNAVFAEVLIQDARHIEVQLVGDGTGATTHLWERDCTLQRRQQKIVEFAPALHLDRNLRAALLADAQRMASRLGLKGIATFEFLVDQQGNHFFIEANPRLQVEHTVTEEITGLDLVALQLALSAGASLSDLGLEGPPKVRGQAMQLRVNAEQMLPDGNAKPSAGDITDFRMPGGPGVRIDSDAGPGHSVSSSYDSLIAKVIVHTQNTEFEALRAKATRAITECTIGGVQTNLGFLAALLDSGTIRQNAFTTSTVELLAPQLVAAIEEVGEATPASEPGTVAAPLTGTVVTVSVAVGDNADAGAELAVIEAMKMEHVVVAQSAGEIREVAVAVGDPVVEGQVLFRLDAQDSGPSTAEVEAGDLDVDLIRPDLAESIRRHGFGLDQNRQEKVAKRHSTGKRTARENLADLVDPGSFVEYGPLVVAAQRKRRSLVELIEQTPGDGMVGGLASVNGATFAKNSQCAVVSYDYMVLAGTQGHQNHRKKDRLFQLAARLRLPVILFAEGGGGRPGDTDGVAVAGLDCLAFGLFAELSGRVPLIGINGGYCFAGNAALLGCCDVVIATENSNVGMGGPAMIEGGGLGVFHPSEIGPADVQRANGVVDIVVGDEAEAVAVAKRYLAYFQGSLTDWEQADQRVLRHLIPENRLRIYDVRTVVDQLFDVGSVLELRADFGIGMITALARVEGRAVGVIANNPAHLAGAITSDGADKASRFMQLCEAFGLPIVNLCDTPGIMVGPEAEQTGLVRHACRMFVTGANLTVPVCTVVLRKGYGLGAQAMAGGGFKSPIFTVGWPTSEFGGMGLEGFVRLGYRNELAAIEDPEERQRAYDQMVAKMYEVGKGVSMADHFEIDDVIDPAETRRWITTAFSTVPAAGPVGDPRAKDRRPFIDTW